MLQTINSVEKKTMEKLTAVLALLCIACLVATSLAAPAPAVSSVVLILLPNCYLPRGYFRYEKFMWATKLASQKIAI